MGSEAAQSRAEGLHAGGWRRAEGGAVRGEVGNGGKGWADGGQSRRDVPAAR